MKKLIDRLHIPPYLFLSQEDEDVVRHRKTRCSFGSTSLYVIHLLLIFWSWLTKLTWCIEAILEIIAIGMEIRDQKLKSKSSSVSVVRKDTKVKQVISRRGKDKNGSEI